MLCLRVRNEERCRGGKFDQKLYACGVEAAMKRTDFGRTIRRKEYEFMEEVRAKEGVLERKISIYDVYRRHILMYVESYKMCGEWGKEEKEGIWHQNDAN